MQGRTIAMVGESCGWIDDGMVARGPTCTVADVLAEEFSRRALSECLLLRSTTRGKEVHIKEPRGYSQLPSQVVAVEQSVSC